jgi:hypothetical protein
LTLATLLAIVNDMEETPMTAEKSNSSYGTWTVRVSPVEIKFFWSKKAALAFIAAQWDAQDGVA